MTADRESFNSNGDHAAVPHPRDVAAAIGLLTILPATRPDHKSEAFARATVFFPVVGLGIGALLVLVNAQIADRLPVWFVGIVIASTWEALTRAQGARACGAILRLQRWPLPIFVAAVVVIAKAMGLAAQRGTRPAALLFAPLLARWCIVVLVTGARDAAAPGQKFNSGVTFREFALTSVFTFAVVFSLAQAAGILAVICIAGVTLGVRLLLHRCVGGVSWQGLNAVAAAVEMLVVALFALL
jgi:adenosylcobinamide-GDP ribazoletransferase